MKKTFAMQDLDCANCAAKMEDAIKKVNGIKDATLSFMTQKLTVEFDEGADIEKVMKEAYKKCRKVEDDCVIYM